MRLMYNISFIYNIYQLEKAIFTYAVTDLIGLRSSPILLSRVESLAA